MNKDAQGRWKVGMSNTKLKMRVNTEPEEHVVCFPRRQHTEEKFVRVFFAIGEFIGIVSLVASSGFTLS